MHLTGHVEMISTYQRVKHLKEAQAATCFFSTIWSFIAVLDLIAY